VRHFWSANAKRCRITVIGPASWPAYSRPAAWPRGCCHHGTCGRLQLSSTASVCTNATSSAGSVGSTRGLQHTVSHGQHPIQQPLWRHRHRQRRAHRRGRRRQRSRASSGVSCHLHPPPSCTPTPSPRPHSRATSYGSRRTRNSQELCSRSPSQNSRSTVH
jgi:hypothetical protein